MTSLLYLIYVYSIRVVYDVITTSNICL